MTPTHHPSEAVLTDYASGAQRPAFAAVTAAHLEACSVCRGRVRLLEEIGGAMMLGLEPVDLAPGSLSRTLGRLKQPSTAGRPPAGPVADRLRFGARRWVAPGVWLRRADRRAVGGDLLYLLRIPAGFSSIPHGHRGCEHTAVLRGAFRDEHGAFKAGDFAEVSDDVQHHPHVQGDDECVCLIASETPMRTHGWMGRLIQAVTGV